MSVSNFISHTQNICGLNSNLSHVQHHLEYDKPHILFLSETQVSEDYPTIPVQNYKL